MTDVYTPPSTDILYRSDVTFFEDTRALNVALAKVDALSQQPTTTLTRDQRAWCAAVLIKALAFYGIHYSSVEYNRGDFLAFGFAEGALVMDERTEVYVIKRIDHGGLVTTRHRDTNKVVVFHYADLTIPDYEEDEDEDEEMSTS